MASGENGPVAGRRFQILSLDGGELRGMFSAAVLARLEEDLDVRIADHFDLIAKLGFLLGAFSKTIESEIKKNLDGLLAKSAADKKPAAKKAAKK